MVRAQGVRAQYYVVYTLDTSKLEALDAALRLIMHEDKASDLSIYELD